MVSLASLKPESHEAGLPAGNSSSYY